MRWKEVAVNTLAAALLADEVDGTPPSFHGFRFELRDPSLSPEKIADQAREHACFGWVQPTPSDSLVGEVRCRGRHGQHMQSWIESNPQAGVLVYPSTKIRYHFTSFRVLDRERRTCFQTAPHACEPTLLPQAKDEL
ncbi:hypothetical protein AC1031_007635 [Aphanomyces cochlioides]|nr:hypothetical protein AC1031_007635 [Aphanomyces cochlioides]